MFRALFIVATLFLHTDSLDLPSDRMQEPYTVENPPILWTANWSPDGKFYAVGGNDKVLRVFAAKNHQLVYSHTFAGAVQCVHWHKEGKLLAVALDHQPALVLNINTREMVVLDEKTGSRALAWSTDGELLAVGDYDGVLRLYNKRGKQIKTINKENTKSYLSVAWHPKKKQILTGSEQIRLFDVSGKLLQKFRHRKEETIVLTAAWHPSGTFFATGDYGHKEEGIGSLLQYWREDGTLMQSLEGSNAEYRNIRWNKTGTLLATASDGLRLWSPDGTLKHRGETTDLLWGVDWDNQGNSIVTTSAKGAITIWNAQAKTIKTVQ